MKSIYISSKKPHKRGGIEMEICTDPTAPDYSGAVATSIIVALMTEDIFLSVLAGLIVYVGVMVIKGWMERYIRAVEKKMVNTPV